MNQKTIKVIHIIGSAHFGGIEKLVFELLQEQKKNPILHTRLLILKGKRGEFLDMYMSLGLDVHFADINSGWDVNIIKYFKIYKLFQKNDIAHFHGFNPLVSICAFFSNVHIIYTMHGGIQDVKKPISHKLKRILQSVFIKKITDLVTFNSHFTKTMACKMFALDQSNIKYRVVYNGIRHIQYSGAAEHKNNQNNSRHQFVVGTSSRFIEQKMIARLISAFVIFHGVYPDSRLMLVGDGPEIFSIKELIKHNDIGTSTALLGFQNDVRYFQQQMDVCVFPSRFEPFGLAAVETLALGKPTIVFSDGGGLVEILNLICPDDIVENEKALADRLQYYFNHRGEGELMAEKRMRIAKTFSIETMAHEIDIFYHEVMRKS